MDNINFNRIYSVSKIQLFEQCPKAYHFNFLDAVYTKMKSELKRDPTNIFIFQTLGKAVHDAITLFFYLSQTKQTLTDLKEQLKLTWRSEAMPQKLPPLGKWGGFQSLKEERETYKQALLMLGNFFKTFKRDVKIKFLPNRNLRKSIEDYKCLIKPLSEEFDISGKFDLVVELADKKLAIIDFKTGKSEDYKDFQLKFYKLLAELNFGLLVQKASFYFLKTGNIREFNMDKIKTEEIKNSLLQKIKTITQAKEFLPKPSVLCRYCLYRHFCPAKKEISQYIKQSVSPVEAEDLPF